LAAREDAARLATRSCFPYAPVSASDDSTLKVWDLATGAVLRTLEGHAGSVNAASVTPDGRRAVSASEDNTLKVWDLTTEAVMHTLKGHADPVNGVSVTPDGLRAMSASDDNTLKIWDLTTRAVLLTLEGHADSINAVAMTPDGQRAVSASDDNTVRVWDLATGAVVATFVADGSAYACAVAPDGATDVAGDALGRVHFLHLERDGPPTVHPDLPPYSAGMATSTPVLAWLPSCLNPAARLTSGAEAFWRTTGPESGVSL
jgi:WD40 repeat protein